MNLAAFLQTAAGLAVLLVGGEFLVRGAIAIAARLGVSPLVIGLTVVAFGTSAPELVVSLTAALEGNPDISVGNVVGSNIANILLILGVSACIRPLISTVHSLLRDGGFLIVTTLLFTATLLGGTVVRWEGTGLFALLVAYLAYTYVMERRAADGADAVQIAAREAEAERHVRLPVAILLVVAGGAGLALGSDLLVEGAVSIAVSLGVSEAVVGLSLVALGTSLPELATAVISAMKRQPDVVYGNVVGSNIFNSLGVIGATGMVTPLPVATTILSHDIWFMLAATVILVPFLLTRWRLTRREGALFVLLYCGYIAFLYVSGHVPPDRQAGAAPPAAVHLAAAAQTGGR